MKQPYIRAMVLHWTGVTITARAVLATRIVALAAVVAVLIRWGGR